MFHILCPDKDDFDGRFLVSFAGKYLAHDYCVALPQVHTEGGSGLHHQLYKILTHCIEPNLLGPLFIEVRIMLYLVVLLSIVSFNKGAFGHVCQVLEDPPIYIHLYVMVCHALTYSKRTRRSYLFPALFFCYSFFHGFCLLFFLSGIKINCSEMLKYHLQAEVWD